MALQGEQLGKYHLEQLLGSGGMGEVYLASDTVIRRQVAIKVIRLDAIDQSRAESTSEASRLFEREVKAIALLDHPHILPLYDYGEAFVRGTPITYMVMPLRQEGTLSTWLRDHQKRGLISPLDVAQLIYQAASALQYAHDRQIVHQDVKPANFLIRTDEQNPHLPYLLLSDFGVARFTSMTTGMSQSIRGTPAYMAPEQWESNSVPATDQYALAIMAFELLTGRPPFTGGMTQMMYQHISVAPPSARLLNQYLSPEIDEVLMVALAKKPGDRFHTIMAFANAFQQAVRSLDAQAIGNIQQMALSPDVHATLAISRDEAEHGSARVLSLSDGRRISVSIPPGTRDGQVLYLNSQGRLVSDPAEGSTIALAIAVTGDQTQASPAQQIYDEKTALHTPPALNDVRGYRGYTPQTLPPTVISSLPPLTATPHVPSRRRTSPVMAVIIVALVLVIIGGGVALYFTRFQSQNLANNGNVTTATVAHASSTPATTPAGTQPSTPGATQLSSGNPYTNAGTLRFNDALTDNSHGNAWMEGTNSAGATCAFSGGVYQSIEPNTGFFHSCMEQATTFTNFVFEVRETMVSGDYEGIVFRVNPNNRNQYYFFAIYTDGTYDLKLSTDANWNNASDLAKSSSPAILTSANQTNVIAVVADFGNLALYVNGTQVASVSDSTLSSGLLGMFAGNETNSAVADFQDARVWQL